MRLFQGATELSQTVSLQSMDKLSNKPLQALIGTRSEVVVSLPVLFFAEALGMAKMTFYKV